MKRFDADLARMLASRNPLEPTAAPHPVWSPSAVAPRCRADRDQPMATARTTPIPAMISRTNQASMARPKPGPRLVGSFR